MFGMNELGHSSVMQLACRARISPRREDIMSQIYRISAGLPVIAADGRSVGFATGVDAGHLALTSVSDGRGFEYAIPLDWVADVDRYIFLSRASRYVEAHRQAVVRGAPAYRPIAA
jgi:hypothetical protein